ncbi:Transcriptional regulator [Seminavis robusta]|uniref:Transcriptional regulator n=1 Tax=Seminavis robusta TaxID=568900 RepID=A0A9N8D9Q6_9STRA|nr:Transcriptional regulator [Seminavis robusta]|eukprot:Sro10_g007950.1 Transcriptional regulator (1317) ;mRNA; r:56587-60537
MKLPLVGNKKKRRSSMDQTSRRHSVTSTSLRNSDTCLDYVHVVTARNSGGSGPFGPGSFAVHDNGNGSILSSHGHAYLPHAMYGGGDDGVSALSSGFTKGRDSSGFSLGVDSSWEKPRENPTDVIEPRSENFRRSMELSQSVSQRRSTTSTSGTSCMRLNKLKLDLHADQRLYGRDAQVQKLRDAFQNTRNTRSRQLVEISGVSGSGKSALAYQLRKLVRQKGGFFLSGKYEQQNQCCTSITGTSRGTVHSYNSNAVEPYAAFTMACRELCDALLAHKENPMHQGDKWQFSFQDVQAKLQQELDTETLQVLTTVFPDLLQIVGGSYLPADTTAPKQDHPSSHHESNSHVNNSTRSVMSTATATQNDSYSVSMGYNEAKNRFNFAIRKLLHIIASFGRVCLFLDDCHWADAASLDLIQNIVTEPNTNTANHAGTGCGNEYIQNGVLILVSYRTEQVTEEHPLKQTLMVIQEHCKNSKNPNSFTIITQQLQVQNLDRNQVNELLADVLSANNSSTQQQETMPLADCIHRKTEGNPLYVIQLLKSLASKQLTDTPLLTFNLEKLQWEWDLEQIEVRERASENVVEMIGAKLQNLPDGIRRLLPVVACLGASFEVSILERVVPHFNQLLSNNTGRRNRSRSNVTTNTEMPTPDENENTDDSTVPPDVFLKRCVAEGILYKQNDKIKWEHDKIQEAAYALLEERELVDRRLQLGRFLMAEYGQADLDRYVFILAGLLDCDTDHLPVGEDNRLILADLNWKAGVKAMKSAAYVSAVMYLDRGMRLLPTNDPWHCHYELSLELYSSAAQAHFCVGDLDKARICCEHVCWAMPGRPILDKQRAYNVWMETINAQGHTEEAMEKCIEVLAQLGLKFPKYGWTMHIMASMLKTELSVQTLEKRILELPVMTDPSRKWAMQLLDMLSTYSYQCQSSMFPLVILKSFQYTIKHGICDYTPPMLCTTGMLMAAVFSDLQGCSKFGKAALALYDRDEISQSTKSRTLFIAAGFTLHWRTPPSHIRLYFLEGYKVGMACGDAVNALWSIFCYLESGFHMGVPLGILEKDCLAYVQQMVDLKQDKISLPTRAVWQMILTMRGRPEDWAPLLRIAERADTDGNSKSHIERLHLHSTFWAGDYQKTVKLIEKHNVYKGEFDKIFHGAHAMPSLHMNCAVAFFALYAETKKNKYKQMAAFHSKKIKAWSKNGNPNICRYFCFVRAEQAALDKNPFPEAVKLFKEAILLSEQQSVPHDRALAHERLAALYIRHGLTSDAQNHLKEAAALFNNWGSPSRSRAVYNPEEYASESNEVTFATSPAIVPETRAQAILSSG